MALLCSTMYLFLIIVKVLLWTLGSSRSCDPDQFRCHDGRRCIGDEYVCDGVIHCRDGSDEEDEVCNTWQCVEWKWKCSNNLCINANDVGGAMQKGPLWPESVSYQKKDGRAGPRPPFFWYDNDSGY